MKQFEDNKTEPKGIRLTLVDLDDNDKVLKDVVISAFVGAVAIKGSDNKTACINLLHGTNGDFMRAILSAQSAVDDAKQKIKDENPLAALLLEVSRK